MSTWILGAENVEEEDGERGIVEEEDGGGGDDEDEDGGRGLLHGMKEI